MVIILLLTISSLCYVMVESKNMDAANIQILKGEDDSLFGYSLATYGQGGDPARRSNVKFALVSAKILRYHFDSLLIGAPGEKSFGGAVHLCEISTAICTNLQMPFSSN